MKDDQLQFSSTDITLFRYLYAQALGNLAPSLLTVSAEQCRAVTVEDVTVINALAKALAIEGEQAILAYEETLGHGG